MFGMEWLIYGNYWMEWGLALGITIATLLSQRVLLRIALRRLKAVAERTTTELDNMAVELLDKTSGFFLLTVAIWAGSQVLELGETNAVLRKVLIGAFFLQVALWGNALITNWINSYARKLLDQDAVAATTLSAIGVIGRVLLWTIVGLLALQNIADLNLGTLIAGLGVGGIAVGLAVQKILGDLIASLSIVLDKPFVIGDFIIVDDLMGTVEHIGLKSTRIRSLSGEQIIFGNGDLLQSRVRNYKRMQERRILFTIGVTYQIPYEKLQAIPGIIRGIIESQPHTRFDRAHFKEFGDFSLNFEVVYYVTVPDYNVYMDVQQAINLEIYRRFAQEGIEFAYPTQTLFLEKSGA
ncbi:Mechanosensitive ion channel MscS [Moorella glycerini]|uniref:Small-conductance mechanosensitive channel n=2 Tax=Neomoorella stamsii TaxID=1266720 RepID=A0A9X7J1N7_9FIRM|nr:Small-conductance mechanosensitive channel [Moorella stamsii]CEP66902.1 Mechanosensitive ion channel MscS [Moorella glycerini]